MVKTILLIGLVLTVVIAIALLYGNFRWASGTKLLRDRIEGGKAQIEPAVFHAHELENLPTPVQRYFQNALTEGQMILAAVSVKHVGTFNLGETIDQWKSFTSTQRVITHRPGFDWDGRIAMMPGLSVPGLSVYVHDAYVSGEGVLHAAMLGLVSIVNLRGTRELAQGELMRFLAEAVWYPTALLPSQGVLWDAIDDRSARATLNDGDLTLTLLFRFNEDGLIDTVYAEARGRTVGNKVVFSPWQGRFWNYEIRDGMRIPLEGEVAWLLPGGAKPYWRGRITSIIYEFAQ
jgi:hypothetical protein